MTYNKIGPHLKKELSTFIKTSHENIWRASNALNKLQAYGLSESYISRNKIGWNPKEHSLVTLYQGKQVIFPRGFVLPTKIGGELQYIVIVCVETNDAITHIIFPEQPKNSMIVGNDSHPTMFILNEFSLDAHIINDMVGRSAFVFILNDEDSTLLSQDIQHLAKTKNCTKIVSSEPEEDWQSRGVYQYFKRIRAHQLPSGQTIWEAQKHGFDMRQELDNECKGKSTTNRKIYNNHRSKLSRLY